MKARETDMPAIKDGNDEVQTENLQKAQDSKLVIPAEPKRLFTNAKCFKTEESQKWAYVWGQQVMAMCGNRFAAQYCQDYGYSPWQAVHNEGTNTQGGYLVFPEIDRNIIQLELEYGSFQANARNVPMTTERTVRDRKDSGLTMYAVGESDAGTESTMAWSQVELIARDWMVLTRLTNQLNNDSIVPIMDALGRDVAMASAKKKDDAGFIGDGTSTYHGITGIVKRLQAVNLTGSTVDEGGGVIMATGNAFSEVVLADFTKLIGILPSYAGTNPKFYCHSAVAGGLLDLLKAAATGNSFLDIQNGKPTRTFLGYPVVTNNSMASAEATNALIVLFGDLSLAADFGDRQQTTMAISDSAYVGSQSVFERNQLALRWTERWDINVHDVGTSTVAGPVVMLGMKSS
jgi:HK97 family phage major capsid protein